MDIKPLIDAKAELTHNDDMAGPIVLSTRTRLARNLNDIPFPGWANESQRRDVLSACMSALSKQPVMNKGTQLAMENLDDLDKQVLTERHLISRELSQGHKESGVFISRNQACSVMVNEEDHLRIQMMRIGMQLNNLWNEINGFDSEIEADLDYAFSADIGYLTACPTNVGTGLRASAMLHLPGLVIAHHMEKVIRMVNQLGIAVRGLFGEGTDATGSIFQISNQQTLGESEEQIIRRLCNVLDAVIEQENNAREKLLEDKGNKIFDKIGRARGVLTNCHLISSDEAMNHLSLMRLAIDMKLLPEVHRQLIDRMMIEIQPGHIQYTLKKTVEQTERDHERARLLREQFSDLPALEF